MTKFEIKYPRWKQRVVGLAAYRVSDHNEVEILAVGKDGERYYPDTYYISGEDVRKCEKQMLPQGIELYLVPIDDLRIKGEPKKVVKDIEQKVKEEIQQIAMDLNIQKTNKIWR